MYLFTPPSHLPARAEWPPDAKAARGAPKSGKGVRGHREAGCHFEDGVQGEVDSQTTSCGKRIREQR